jgi:hypothetical protein
VRGVKLGSPENLTDAAKQKARQAISRNAVEAYKKVAGYISLLRDKGSSYQRIADQLNAEGHRTRNGKNFRDVTVMRIYRRVQISPSSSLGLVPAHAISKMSKRD